MNVRLVVERDGRRIRVIQLTPPEAVVGRGTGNVVRIPSAEVSRKHCRLILRDGVVRVEDLASVNGTFLNGGRVFGQALVHPGDRLDVGPVSFLVEYEPQPEAVAQLTGDEALVEVLEVDSLPPGVLELVDEVPEVLAADEDDPPLRPLNEDAAPLPTPTQLGNILRDLDAAEVGTEQYMSRLNDQERDRKRR
jgi:pSer/pThr/pTyr-binding forkhead associated (FHA) protein